MHVALYGVTMALAPVSLEPFRPLQGNADFLYQARRGLFSPSTGVSFQSVNYPSHYLGIISASVGANTAQGSLRLGNVLPGDAKDNVTWSIVAGLAGGFNTYSFQASGAVKVSYRVLISCRRTFDFFANSPQSMSRTPGVKGLFMTLFSGTLTGYCAGDYASPAGDVALSSGADATAATWVLYPPLSRFSCSQVWQV